jgi:seryl-tRNA synthetase
MIDLAFVRANLALVEEKLRARGMDPASALGNFAAVDRERRDAITQVETLKAERNKLTEEIAKLRRSGADTSFQEGQNRSKKIRETHEETRAAQADERLREMMQILPNLPQDSVPVGKDEHSNREEKTWGELPKFDFPAKPHWELGEALGILDFNRAAKISGSRFVVHFGQGARLERALANFMLDLHTREHGYTEVLPPYMVNKESLYGTGQLPKFEDDLFKVPRNSFEQDVHHVPIVGEEVYERSEAFRVKQVDGWDVTIELIGAHPDASYVKKVPRGALSYKNNLYLIPTAEVPVTNLFRDETLDEAQLPISYCAYTPCFRSEAGSYGKDVRGMIRQHQFQKVELVKFAKPADSEAEHEALTRHAETVLEKLGLPYRRMLLCTGDMGFASSKTYDLEVWLPGQGLYREISSCSNFEAFQARRANIRYRPTGAKKSEFLHTLNGSGLAVGRTYLAILENYQQADGTIKVPNVLVPYMNGDTIIGKQSGRS